MKRSKGTERPEKSNPPHAAAVPLATGRGDWNISEVKPEMVELNDLEQHQIKEIFDTFSDWEVIMNGEEFDLGGGPS